MSPWFPPRPGSPQDRGAGEGHELCALRVSRPVAILLAARGTRRHGTVHSVFRRAANVQLGDDNGAQGTLLSLTTPEMPLAPNGLSLDLPSEAAFPALGLTPGAPVLLDQSTLHFPAAQLTVAWRDAARWEPRPPIRAGVSRGTLAESLRRLRSLVLTSAGSAGLTPLLWYQDGRTGGVPLDRLIQLALPAALALEQAAATRDAARVGEAAARLAGLGPGLTPSGDDLLAGFVAAWTLAREGLGRTARADAVAAAVLQGAASRASTLGRCWLEYGARGEVAEPHGALLAALCDGEARALEARALAVLGIGATSGADWLTGVVLGGRTVLRAGEGHL